MQNHKKEIMDAISELEVDCPDCGDATFNDEYTCTVCWQEGGNGKINVLHFLKENKDLIL